MTPPKPLTPWQQTLPDVLPRHIRRAIEQGSDGCWTWRNSTDPDGYGWASLNNKTWLAHRLVFTLVKGKHERGLQLDHTCHSRNLDSCPGGRACTHRRCVNPDHLEPVTGLENQQRGHTPAGMTECAKGHTLSDYHGQRRCLTCLEAYRQARRTGTNRNAKLTPADVYEIRAQHSAGASVNDLAAVFPVGRLQMQISRIVRRERWAHLPEVAPMANQSKPGAVVRVWRIGGAL